MLLKFIQPIANIWQKKLSLVYNMYNIAST